MKADGGAPRTLKAGCWAVLALPIASPTAAWGAEASENASATAAAPASDLELPPNLREPRDEEIIAAWPTLLAMALVGAACVRFAARRLSSPAAADHHLKTPGRGVSRSSWALSLLGGAALVLFLFALADFAALALWTLGGRSPIPASDAAPAARAVHEASLQLLSTGIRIATILALIGVGRRRRRREGPLSEGSPALASLGWRVLPLRQAPWCLLFGLGLMLATNMGVAPLVIVLFHALKVPWETHRAFDMLLNLESKPLFVAVIAMICLGIPFIEEVIFRGLLLPMMERVLSRRGALAASAAVFALAHYPVLYSLVPVFGVGLALGWVFQRTRGLAAPVIVHGVFNALNLALAFADFEVFGG